jgi:hypothetical protein
MDRVSTDLRPAINAKPRVGIGRRFFKGVN